jgi:hypothetical protein
MVAARNHPERFQRQLIGTKFGMVFSKWGIDCRAPSSHASVQSMAQARRCGERPDDQSDQR